MSSVTASADISTIIHVLIADDHAVVRKGIRALLMTEPDIEVVGEAENGRQAIDETARLDPDVILMDIMMPEMDGIEAIRRISVRRPEVRILVLTSFATDEKVFPAIKAGALGYLLKDSEPAELVQAIHQVYRREPSLHPKIAGKVLRELAHASEQKPTPEPLTEQETEILRLVTRGQNHHEIGGQQGISEAAVPGHINTILSKLHLANRTQAVLYALQEGLATLDDAAPTYVSELLATLPDARLESLSEIDTLRRIAADYKQVEQELASAWEIQASFLPTTLPELTGWQITAALEPAKETSGDFYDFIPLPDGQLGILIADVAGKGMGAALYMALSRTLIRTYAAQYGSQPESVFDVVNRRILMDTQAKLFVTIFYGVLNPAGGVLTYSNAGHNPPFLFQNKDTAHPLIRTGIPLGIFEESTWEQETVQLDPGDTLVLYTDGITEAQDQENTSFESGRLLAAVQANLGSSAQTIKEALLTTVHNFMADSNVPRDDITLMVIVRDKK